MDIRKETVQNLLKAIHESKREKEYMFLLNELLSIFNKFADKSLKSCEKGNVMKYILKEKRNLFREKLYKKFDKLKLLYFNKDKAGYSDSIYNIMNKKNDKLYKKYLCYCRKKKKKSKLHFYLVIGEQEENYVVIKNFCTCYYYKQSVLCNHKDILCKHILSGLLSPYFEDIKYVYLEEDLFFEEYFKTLHK